MTQNKAKCRKKRVRGVRRKPPPNRQKICVRTKRLVLDASTVGTGEFGADMKVALVNDGPVTICIDTKNKGDYFLASATVWHKRSLLLHQLNVSAMLEIIISVALYAAAIVFLVKSTFAYCNRSGHDIITEP